jgi:hypothetical protein
MRASASTSARHTNKTGPITIARTTRATAITVTQMSIAGSGGTGPIIGIITIESNGTTIGIDESLGLADVNALREVANAQRVIGE